MRLTFLMHLINTKRHSYLPVKCQVPRFAQKHCNIHLLVSSLIVLLYSVLALSIIVCEMNCTATVSNHGSSNKVCFILTIDTSHSFLYSSIMFKEIMLKQKLDTAIAFILVSDTRHFTILSTNMVLQHSPGHHTVYIKWPVMSVLSRDLLH